MTVHQKKKMHLQSRTKSGNLSRFTAFLNAYDKNYHASFQRVECFPGRNKAAFCELNEGKLPSLKCSSVTLLTYDKSNSLFACHLTGDM